MDMVQLKQERRQLGLIPLEQHPLLRHMNWTGRGKPKRICAEEGEKLIEAERKRRRHVVTRGYC